MPVVSFFAALSLLAALINSVFAYLILKKSPRNPLNRVFGSMFILTGVMWPLAECLLRMTTDPAAADLLAKLAWSPVIVSTAQILHLACVITKSGREGRQMNLPIAGAYLVSLAVVGLNFTTDLVISGAHMEYWGYTGTFGDGFKLFYVPYHVAILAYSFHLMYRKYRLSESSIERIQLRSFLVGLSFPYLAGSVMQIALPLLDITPIPLGSTTTILMDGLIAHAIIRYKLLTITPTVEGMMETRPRYDIKPKTYLTLTKDPEKGMLIYVDQILHDRRGLLVSFRDPAEIRRMYNIARTPIIRLTDDEASEGNVPPKDLLQLSLLLKDFIRASADNGILYLDGIDELIALNGFQKAYGLIRGINAERAKTKASVLIPIRDHDDHMLISLELRREDVEREIVLARARFRHNVIDEESLRGIVKDFQKELIEIDLKMGKLERRRAGEEMEII